MSALQLTGNPVDPPLARVGELLDGRWRLERFLGAGASAEVYEAQHRNGNRVAVKVLHEGLAGHPVACSRLYAESLIANRVAHPNLVRVYDDGVTNDGCPFLVMELLEGESVEQRLLTGRLPLMEALDIADQVLDALSSAHAAGVTHLDVKPGNVFCCTDGTVRLLDFGVAASTTEGVGPLEGIVVGTPAFMSPEQTRGIWSLVDGRSDLWSVGATLFNMITGRPVRVCTSPREVLRLAGTEPVPSLRAVGDVPDEVAELVDRALQFDCRQRYPSARDMQHALREVRARLSDDANAITATSTLAGSSDSSVAAVNAFALPVDQVESSLTVTLEGTVQKPRRRHWVVPLAAASLLVVWLAPNPVSWLNDVVSAAYFVETSVPVSTPPAPPPMPVAMHHVTSNALTPLLSRDANDDVESSRGSSSSGTAHEPAASPNTTKTKAPVQWRRLRRTDARPGVASSNPSSGPHDREDREADSRIGENDAQLPFDPLARRL